MNLNCNPALGAHLTSPSQQIKAISEGWFTAHGYCLNCTSPHVKATTAGTPFRDHVCPVCAQSYEMKSAKTPHRGIVQNGGYESMMREIRADKPPALMLMQYNPTWCVQRLIAVHPVFVVPSIIRKRAKPHTRPKSGQLYWMCDFDLSVVPDIGKIVVVSEHKARPEKDVRADFEALKPLVEVSKRTRGWTGLVLDAVRKIGKPEFTLAEVYAFEESMHAVYPQNSHVRDKIRQQMQTLRDLGYVQFIGHGGYRALGSICTV